MDSETTKSDALFGYCSKCGRKLTNPRSNTHGMGACCWRKHLESLSDNDRETMRGYNWFKSGDIYIVTTPEHNHYQIDPHLPRCECIAFTAGGGSPCKHVLWVRRETGWTAPDSPQTPQAEQGTVSALRVEWIDYEYARVSDGDRVYYPNWLHPNCACAKFTLDHEICVHIRAAQDEVNRQAQTRQERGETPEARRARVQRDIDGVFDER